MFIGLWFLIFDPLRDPKAVTFLSLLIWALDMFKSAPISILDRAPDPDAYEPLGVVIAVLLVERDLGP